MSLRVVHIVFVIACIGLTLCVAIWGIRTWSAERNAVALTMAVVFLGSGIALVVYARRALVKLWGIR